MEDEVGVWILALTLLGAGAGLVWLGRKQRAGTLRRNWLAGLRTWETMASDAAWRQAHSATAGLVTAAGIVFLAAGVALALLRPEDDATLLLVLLGPTAVAVGLVLTAGVRGHRIAAHVNRSGDPDRQDAD